jgi:hypothetical protein
MQVGESVVRCGNTVAYTYASLRLSPLVSRLSHFGGGLPMAAVQPPTSSWHMLLARNKSLLVLDGVEVLSKRTEVWKNLGVPRSTGYMY